MNGCSLSFSFSPASIADTGRGYFTRFSNALTTSVWALSDVLVIEGSEGRRQTAAITPDGKIRRYELT